MCSGGSDWTCLQPGFPIRKSSDHSLVIDSPRLIADSYVLLRFLVPRHPPCALKNLICTKILRCSRPLCSSQHTGGPPPTPAPTPAPRSTGQRCGSHAMGVLASTRPEGELAPEPSGPNNVSGTGPHPRPLSTPPKRGRTREPGPGPAPTNRCSTREHPLPHTRGQTGLCTDQDNPGRRVLLRKEVIQPHLPVRLPCYDLVPIASPTFDGSLPQGVGPPASGVTDFRDLTGGVYKARERIHRSVADLRLLATPTSWGRVADPNPN